MARQNINLGTNPNDGTGDKLRVAMEKVNENLIELYSRTGGDATLTGVGIGVVGNVLGINGDMTITTNNVGNLTIAAPVYATANMTLLNGYLRIATTEVDATTLAIINGNTKIKGNITLGNSVFADTVTLNSTISSSIIPTLTESYDLGTPSQKFKILYSQEIQSQKVISSNVSIIGGSINSTLIGDTNPSEGRFSILRCPNDTFLGDLLIRENQITTNVLNSDIEIRPFGTGNLLVTTRMVIGQTDTPIGEAIIKAVGNTDGFVQSVIQNLNPSASSSADFFIPRDDGDDDNNYLDMGINSSTYQDPAYPIHTAGSSYLYTANSELFIGTYDAKDVVFHAGNDLQFNSIMIRLKGDTQNVIIGPEDGSTIVVDTGEKLQINGDIRVNGNIKIQSRTIASSIGQEGDVSGIIAVDSSYVYYCTANYDGSTSIWSRVQLNTTPW